MNVEYFHYLSQFQNFHDLENCMENFQKIRGNSFNVIELFVTSFQNNHAIEKQIMDWQIWQKISASFEKFPLIYWKI